jgi:hypothetical protein
MAGGVLLEPDLQGRDPVHQGSGSLPLTGELLDVVVAPLGIDNFHLVVAVQEGQVGLPPGPVGELRRGRVRRAIQRCVQVSSPRRSSRVSAFANSGKKSLN